LNSLPTSSTVAQLSFLHHPATTAESCDIGRLPTNTPPGDALPVPHRQTSFAQYPATNATSGRCDAGPLIVQAYRPRSSQSETPLAKVCRMNAEGEDPCHRVQSLLCKSKMLKVDYISSKHGRRLLYPCELPSLPVLSHLRQRPMT
jgi:hypothetical protein